VREVKKYSLPPSLPGAHQQWLNLGYAAANLRGTLPDTTGIVVESVSLVFTRYPANPNAWRHEFGVLLQDRYTALYQVLPQAFAPGVDWSWTLQTACTTEAQAMKLPHGFVVRYHYRSPEVPSIPSRASGNEGTSGNEGPAVVSRASTPSTSPPAPEDLEGAGGPAGVSRASTPAGNSAILELLLAHPMYSAVEVGRIVSGEQAVKDSTVLRTLVRHPEWKDMLVVMDWTSSMYHYGASALLWHKLNLDARRVKGFTFFNDGNYMPDIDKNTPGKVGGVYHSGAASIDSVMLLMERVMRAGDGGDLPENDLEAVVKGIRRFPDHGDVVLIADNTSDVRDLVLLSDIVAPVHVILCGPEYYPAHPHYLQIARMTGGSIHTLTEDITNLSTQQNGDFLDIGRFRYRIVDGRWKAVSKM
jgi:hypothetical protein